MKHIDLYHKEFQPYRTPALVRILQVAAIVLLAGGVGVYFWHSSRLAELQERLQKAESTSSQLNTELSSIEQRLKAQQSDPRLERRIAALRQKLKVQRPLFDLLEHMSARRGQGIAVLSSLAQQPLPQVWFTRIHLDTRAANITLEGAGLDAAQISRAFDTLMAQEVFAGQDFAHLRIERDEEGIYRFTLASALDAKESP